jgi:hypothetical protein
MKGHQMANDYVYDFQTVSASPCRPGFPLACSVRYPQALNIWPVVAIQLREWDGDTI